jgi:copper chaperone
MDHGHIDIETSGDQTPVAPRRLPRMVFVFYAIAAAAIALYFLQIRPARQAQASNVVKVAVEGMTCAGCATSVTAEVMKVNGVAMVRVDRKQEQAVVTLARPDVDRMQIVNAIENAGYEATIQDR